MTLIRARDLGIPFSGKTGPLNAITDVAEVKVGFQTLISDLPSAAGAPVAVRTGVTAILPASHNKLLERTWAGFSSFNGNGELTGAHWINEAGYFQGPILLTNTHSVGMAHHACLKWLTSRDEYVDSKDLWLLPIVAETCDADLNDINGFHVEVDDVYAAIDSATSGPVAEGNVGGGTGMCCYQYKGGSGSASRVVSIDNTNYTVGALVQANFGLRKDLIVAGIPIGQKSKYGSKTDRDSGSLIVVIATDAPLQPLQLQRIARRCALGMARTGTPGYNGSGDLFVAFSTAKASQKVAGQTLQSLDFLPAEELDSLFEATVESTEEAIINAIVAADSMTGHHGRSAQAINHDWLASFFPA